MADFLFEVGLEEIPARMIAGAQAELGKRVQGEVPVALRRMVGMEVGEINVSVDDVQ